LKPLLKRRCDATSALAAASKAGFTPRRFGTSSRYPPNAHVKLYLRSESSVNFTLSRTPPTKMVKSLLGEGTTSRGGDRLAGLAEDDLDSSLSENWLLNLYLRSPEPVQGIPSRLHLEHVGFVSSHYSSDQFSSHSLPSLWGLLTFFFCFLHCAHARPEGTPGILKRLLGTFSLRHGQIVKIDG